MTCVRQRPKAAATFIRQATQEQVDKTKATLRGQRQGKNTPGPVKSGPSLNTSVFFSGPLNGSAPTNSGGSGLAILASATSSQPLSQP